MVRLMVVGMGGDASLVDTSSYFRVNGGAVWRRPGEDALVRYADGGWQHLGRRWDGMRFEGSCRLVIGLPREPARVSDAVRGFSIHDCTLSTGGIPFAVYVPPQDMWRGVIPETWWNAFRIESAELRADDGL